jgi:hypothetical protein
VHNEIRVLLYGGFSGGGIDGTILSIDPGMKQYFSLDDTTVFAFKQMRWARGVSSGVTSDCVGPLVLQGRCA